MMLMLSGLQLGAAWRLACVARETAAFLLLSTCNACIPARGSPGSELTKRWRGACAAEEGKRSWRMRESDRLRRRRKSDTHKRVRARVCRAMGELLTATAAVRGAGSCGDTLGGCFTMPAAAAAAEAKGAAFSAERHSGAPDRATGEWWRLRTPT